MTGSTPADPSVARTPGRKVSLRDVAATAGVSPAAVSKVIRNAYGVSPGMRERVQAAIDELGYRPRFAARAMRGSSFTIGLELPELSNDFFTQIVGGVATVLADTPYHLIVAPGLGYLSAEAVLDSLIDRQVDGIIALASKVPLERLEQVGTQVPLILLGRHEASVSFDTVNSDDVAGTRLVLDHLLGLGHTRIAHVTLRPWIATASQTLRHDTYVTHMERAGLEPQVSYVRLVEDSERVGAGTDSHRGVDRDVGEAVAELLSRSPRPTAIFAGHDMLALDTLRVTRAAGLGPHEVAVVGYDGVAIADHPLVDLTTIDQSGPTMGATAIRLLMERILGDRSTAVHEEVGPALRLGRTSAPPVATS
ncbi:LacI family DNA-binding transcriptional regulator [Agilicoccus flavus]|uniref:LacI family DNA-binding transcriptional regulator n=1 Tax=Agilicoccus flavus TaxID=2775968 RepID=UPI001CF657E2|nr:LacI family DNA-binding transcriptional regulator [Agilicoccus flavus]